MLVEQYLAMVGRRERDANNFYYNLLGRGKYSFDLTAVARNLDIIVMPKPKTPKDLLDFNQCRTTADLRRWYQRHRAAKNRHMRANLTTDYTRLYKDKT